MAAAESISDLRSLLSIVAEETGALKMNDADEDSVGWTTEGPLPMTFGHVRRAHSALAALEAALSAAEPVACEYGHDNGDGTYSPTYARWPLPPHIKPHGDMPVNLFYAAPPAPSVAVKALEWKEIDLRVGNPPMVVWEAKTPFVNYTLESVMERPWFCHFICAHFTDLEKAKAAAQADYEARIRSALSAQVQDVTGDEEWQIVPKHPTGSMIEAVISMVDDDAPHPFILNLYRAMLAAAPAKQEG